MAGQYTVDEHGRCSGFRPVDLDEVDSFGANLAGEVVERDADGAKGYVTRVYGHIQTGNPGSGTSNYVAVDIDWQE